MPAANRSDLIKLVQRNLGTTRGDARAALEAVLEGLTSLLEENERVSVAGFGAFHAYERGPLRRYDMNTGRTRTLPPMFRIRFTPSHKLLEAVSAADV